MKGNNSDCKTTFDNIFRKQDWRSKLISDVCTGILDKNTNVHGWDQLDVQWGKNSILT